MCIRDRFQAIYLTEPSTQQTMMANQELEISSPWFAPENYEALDEIEGVELAFTTWACTQYIFFNTLSLIHIFSSLSAQEWVPHCLSTIWTPGYCG